MRPRRAVLLLLPCAAAVACNALSGVGDLETGALPCPACVTDGGTDASQDAPAPDTSVVPEGAAPRPTFCRGIVLYAGFDGTLATATGGSPDEPAATRPFDAGRYGSSALLTGSEGALFYPQGKSGFTMPTPGEGTFLTWFKPLWSWPPTVDRTVWKMQPDRDTVAGKSLVPYVGADFSARFFGTMHVLPDAGAVLAGATFDDLVPYWKDKDWNHLAETWSESAGTFTFTLNGGTGDLAATHHESTTPWSLGFSEVGVLRLSSNVITADAFYDDVAVWDRALSLGEVRAVYEADQPLGVLCGL